MNLDTDLQYAYLAGIRDYVLQKKDYLLTQVGNPEGKDKPNKKYVFPFLDLCFDDLGIWEGKMANLCCQLGSTILVSGCVRVRRL